MFLRQRLPRLLQRKFLWNRSISSLPPPPPVETWKAEFPETFGRVSTLNSNLADYLARAFVTEPKDGDEGKIVIEAYPGPGVLTRSLLSLPESRLKRLIVLEEEPNFLKYLQVLEQHDPRITVIPTAGMSWASYTDIESRGLLDDVKDIPWEEGEPNLQFISHIPNTVMGDQIVAQFFRSIPQRTWLFKYGRVQMSFLLRCTLWDRIRAPPTVPSRCKVSVISEAVAEFSDAIPNQLLIPHERYFHPPNTNFGKKDTRGVNVRFSAVNIKPKLDSDIQQGMLDKWDYVTRHLFVLKSTPLKKAIKSLGFGAENLLKPLQDPSLPPEDRVDVTKKVRDLTVQEWSLIVRAFDNWPFAPDHLSIADRQYVDIERDRD